MFFRSRNNFDGAHTHTHNHVLFAANVHIHIHKSYYLVQYSSYIHITIFLYAANVISDQETTLTLYENKEWPLTPFRVCMFVYTCMHAYHAYMHTYMCERVQGVAFDAFPGMYVCIHIHACMHKYIHTMHTCVHTCVNESKEWPLTPFPGMYVHVYTHIMHTCIHTCVNESKEWPFFDVFPDMYTYIHE
jgi:hypothetical protein